MRRDKRSELKRKLKDEGTYGSKRTRLYDSDDEELLLGNDMDGFHEKKKEFIKFISYIMNNDQAIIGAGVPQRCASYILGAHNRWVSDDHNVDTK